MDVLELGERYSTILKDLANLTLRHIRVSEQRDELQRSVDQFRKEQEAMTNELAELRRKDVSRELCQFIADHDEELRKEIETKLGEGKKIHAIKVLRDRVSDLTNGPCLRSCKEVIDRWEPETKRDVSPSEMSLSQRESTICVPQLAGSE